MQLFGGLETRLEKLEAENTHLFNVTNILVKRLAELEKLLDGQAVQITKEEAKKAAAKEESDDDSFRFDDSDEEEEDTPQKETELQKMRRLAAEKKAKADADKAAAGHQGAITKSNVIFDVKPWDDETDLEEMERQVRNIKMEGLVWGDSKFKEIGYGIKKLTISSAIVDHLVGLYDLEDKITEIEDLVQSVDIAAHNKI